MPNSAVFMKKMGRSEKYKAATTEAVPGVGSYDPIHYNDLGAKYNPAALSASQSKQSLL